MSDLEKIVSQNIDKLTDAEEELIITCASSFRFGGNWSYIRSSKEGYKNRLETLKSAIPNVALKQLKNGALILANENFISASVNKIIPNAINSSFIQMAVNRRNLEREEFKKFVESIAKGKSSYVLNRAGNFSKFIEQSPNMRSNKHTFEYYSVRFGLYSFNDTNRIRNNGVDYPAYKLTLEEAIYYLSELASKGVRVYVRYVDASGNRSFLDVTSIGNNEGVLASVYREMSISESDTGVFLDLFIF